MSAYVKRSTLAADGAHERRDMCQAQLPELVLFGSWVGQMHGKAEARERRWFALLAASGARAGETRKITMSLALSFRVCAISPN
jgi:hypothetical protein